VDEYALLPDTCARMIIMLPSSSSYTPAEQRGAVTARWGGPGTGTGTGTGTDTSRSTGTGPGTDTSKGPRPGTCEQDAVTVDLPNAHCGTYSNYVFAYPQCSLTIHAPHQGCTAFLVCDIVYPVRTGQPRSESESCEWAERGSLCCVSARVRREPVFADNSDVVRALEGYAREWEEDSRCEKLGVVLDERWEAMHESGGISFANLRNERDKGIVQTLMNCSELMTALAGGFMCMCLCVCIRMQVFICAE
jgi:hypothetical protein